MTKRPHDALFKAAFGAPVHVVGLFHDILPPAVITAIDWPTLAREPGTFVEPDLGDRFSDLLFSARVRARSGTRVLLYVLLEHQSTVEPDMPLRVLGYEVRIWEDYRGQHPRGPRPLIVSAVLSHAPGGWTEPNAFEALFAPDPADIPGLAALVPRFEVVAVDLAHLSNTDIKVMSLAGFQKLALWLMRDTRDAARLQESFPDWELLLREAHAKAVRTPHGMKAFAQLMHYVWYVAGGLRFQDFRGKLLEHVPDAEETVMTIAEELIREGHERGRQQGRVEERVAMLRKLLALKFGAIGPDLTARLAAATPDELERYLERIVAAKTAVAVFED